MRKAFLFLLVIMLFPISALSGVGDSDNRYYVTDEMWNTEPYKKFVLLISYVSETYVNVCTGQYVSPNLILSAGHCVKQGAVYKARNHNQKDFDVELLDKEYVSTSGNDWAVFFVKDSQYYGDSYFDISLPNETENYISVLHAGYGWMRILTDEEIKKVKKFIKKINLKYLAQFKFRGATLEELAEEIQKSNLDIATLRENYPPRLKASNCQLVFKDCSLNASGCDIGHRSLKLSENYPNIVASTCDSMNGDSGGGYIGNDGYLYAVVSYGSRFADAAFNDAKEFSYASSSLQFKEKIASLISKYPASYTKDHDIDIPVQEVSSDVATNDDETIDTYSLQFNIEELQQRNSILRNKQLPTDSELITSAMVLQIANSITEYQTNEEKIKKLEKLYEAAKKREQSLANKTLTAVTTAAMGIGGMELAMGLSEKAADKDAEQDMAAYLSTFRCSYTDGKSFKGGPDPIELPGGNDAKIMSYRNEYMTLAKDLKERKEALGMKPGIESEEILDKSDMGLYDDENVGITSGVYGSLYRATALNSAEDQAKIQEEKDKSAKRVKGGAIAAGVGAGVGILGNSLINGKLGELVKGKRSKEEQKKVTESYTSLSNSSTALMRMKSTGTELSVEETNELLQAIRDKFK